MKRIYKRTGQVLAVAALATAGIGAAQAHEFQIDPNTTFNVGGTIQVIYVRTDLGNDSDRQMVDNGSDIHFYGTHKFTDDFSAYIHLAYDYNFTDEGDGNPDSGTLNSFSADATYAGVISKRFGGVRVGFWDGIYDNYINDKIAIMQYGGGATGAPQTQMGDAIAYYTPTFGGFSLAVEGILNGDDVPGHPVGSPEPNGQAVQAVAQYQTDMFSVVLGYDSLGLDPDSDGTIGLGASVDLSPLTLNARIENYGGDDSPSGTVGSSDYYLDKDGFSDYGVAAIYDYGHGQIVAKVNQIEPDNDNVDSRTEWALEVNYNIADNFLVYVEHYSHDRDNGVSDYTGTGFFYAF